MLYTNRAAANLMLLQYKDAIIDCDTAISIDSTPNAKAHFRKAAALKGLGNINGAIDSLSTGLLIDPSSTVAQTDRTSLIAAKDKIEQLRLQISSKDFRRALPAIDALIREIGSTFRDVNILKVECLVELKRTEEAYNLTNSMVGNLRGQDTTCRCS